jgi:hypothetical protein
VTASDQVERLLDRTLHDDHIVGRNENLVISTRSHKCGFFISILMLSVLTIWVATAINEILLRISTALLRRGSDLPIIMLRMPPVFPPEQPFFQEDSAFTTE